MNKTFFNALELHDCATTEKGWQASHLSGDDFLIPAYVKEHSWGEYVFDHSWANTYHHYGYKYYPKLVSAIPFTPVPSEKAFGINYPEAFSLLSEHAQNRQLSSWHMLFMPKQDVSQDVFERLGVQFIWRNNHYRDFQDYLDRFSSRKRKNLRKERAQVEKQGLEVLRVKGSELSKQQLDFFYLCYQITYLKRGHTPHLSKAFFQYLVAHRPDDMLFVFAKNAEEYKAAALFFYNDDQLFGRYWGSTESFDMLHFELCYYQGIAFCIENNIASFNPGTQGEHKIQRGFAPEFVYSYHWLNETAFRPAIENFCKQEAIQVTHYAKQCETLLPFKQDPE